MVQRFLEDLATLIRTRSCAHVLQLKINYGKFFLAGLLKLLMVKPAQNSFSAASTHDMVLKEYENQKPCCSHMDPHLDLILHKYNN